MVELVVINSFEGLNRYKEQWNALLQNSDSNEVFMTYEFCRSWWDAYGQGRELLVLLAKENSKLVGVAPLNINVRQRFGLKKRMVEFVGAPTSDYEDFVIGQDKNAILEAIYSYLWSIRNRWDEISLRQIPEDSSTVELSKSCLKRLEKPYLITPASSCPTVMLKGSDGEEVLCRAFRRQRSFKNRMNRLMRLGELKYGHATTVEEGLMYLDAFFQQHINRWENTVTPSTFYNERDRQFFRQLIRQLLPKGWTRLAYLNLNCWPIALFLGFEYNNSLSHHRPSYDQMYSKYSPGRVIIYHAVKYCIEKGLREFDLLAGMEPYKLVMTNRIRCTSAIHVYKSPLQKLLGRLDHMARRSRFFSPIFRDSWIWRLRMYLRKYRRRYGTIAIAKKVIYRLTSRIFDFSSSQLFEWRGLCTPELSAECPLEIRFGNDSDLNSIASFHAYTEKSPEIAVLRERLEKGDRPYLAFSGKTLAHVAWVCRRKQVDAPEIWASLLFKDNQAYIRDCKTSFIFRGKNVYPVVLQHILRDLKAENVGTVYIACRTSNTASLKGIEKAGFLPIRKIQAVRLFGRKIGVKIIQAA